MKKLGTILSLMLCTGSAFAKNTENQITDVLSLIPTHAQQSQAKGTNTIRSAANSSVVLDFSMQTGQSWDAKGDNNNVLVNCVNGTTITGFEFNNVTIETAANSYFSEAVLYFSDSNNGNNGLRLTIGAGDVSSGTKTFSSNGILDLTDNGLDDIIALNDGIFLTELYENIDDFPNAIDARYLNGTVTVWGVDLLVTNTCPFSKSMSETFSDLSVIYSAQMPDDAKLNDTIELSILVGNTGAATASTVRLKNTLSDKLSFNAISCNDGTNSTNPQVLNSLQVSDIPSNQSLLCHIDATIIAYGMIENSLTVTADNDSNNSNNNATLMLNGVFRLVPINQPFALLMLLFLLAYCARKKLA